MGLNQKSLKLINKIYYYLLITETQNFKLKNRIFYEKSI